jgi:hypothetical protein
MVLLTFFLSFGLFDFFMMRISIAKPVMDLEVAEARVRLEIVDSRFD